MAEVIRYSNEFLPHVVRLFCPDAQKVDARLSYFRQLFALHEPGPEKSCVLVKATDRLLASAYLVSLDSIQPGLIYTLLAVEKNSSEEVWDLLWTQCKQLGSQMAPSGPTFRIVAGDLPSSLQNRGFKVVREQAELHAQLGQLPPDSGYDDFHVYSLSQRPELEKQWLEAFNIGNTVFWDMPLLDNSRLNALKAVPGVDLGSFRLGFDGDEPVSALFYTVMDSEQGIVRINAAATPSAKRSKGYGRKMLKDVLNHLEGKGFSTAVIYTDTANQATNLLFKMLGFKPVRNVKILEYSTIGSPRPAPVESKSPANQQTTSAKDAPGPDLGFFPVSSSAYSRKK